MISLKKAYKLRQTEVRAECEINREKFELMIGSMKEMQRNIKSLKENLHELEKEKHVRNQLQIRMNEQVIGNLPQVLAQGGEESPENMKIKLETKLEYLKIKADELEKDVSYRKLAILQNEYIFEDLEDLLLKIKPWEGKIEEYEAMNTMKTQEIQELKEKMDKLDIGNHDDAQMLKQKYNIVVSVLIKKNFNFFRGVKFQKL